MRRLLATGAVVTASLGVFAGDALADSTSTAQKKPTSSTTPGPPATPPQKASAKLYFDGVFVVHHGVVTLPGRNVAVHGFVFPYVAGQSVQINAYIGKKLLASRRMAVKPSAGKPYGSFTATVKAPRPGIVRVQVTHPRSSQMSGFFAQRAFAALNPHVGSGATGPLVDLIQQRLSALHVFVPQTGRFDEQTGLALDAYHRLLGWGEGSQNADQRTLAALMDGRGTFRVRYPNDGNHVEGNLGIQVLALINGSQVYRIYPISSGKPSTPTILGRFQVYYRVKGYLPDGMYYSSFFYRGYAVHGYDPAPDYPASHGCMRLPIIDAIGVFDWLSYGDWVDVYQ
ncbi:MAG: L,D-transpeptidase [Solirubrobacteraceae bacterium]